MIYVDRNTFNIPISERVLGHYGDNSVNSVTFEIGENYPESQYILYLSFSNGSINSILLDKSEDNTAVWNIKSEHIFAPGIAHMQIKAVSENGEIWHSPKVIVEFLHSIDENKPNGRHIPSLFEKFDSILTMLSENSDKGFITRTEAVQLIDELLMPLSKRLDGE